MLYICSAVLKELDPTNMSERRQPSSQICKKQEKILAYHVCFSSSSGNGQLHNFLTGKNYTFCTLALENGYRDAILEIWPAFGSF